MNGQVETQGRAYYLPEPSFDEELTRVGRGTPMGEMLRRYWHPVGLVEHATETPRRVRALGEDLVLFRGKDGKAGLLHERCCHRGASLFFGKVEECSIRCCYHGWAFDAEGNCLEQPMDRSEKKRYGAAFRQPWYPVQELYGLIWTYMGPADKQPVLPRYELLEELAEGEFIDADDTSIGSGGPAISPCNWLQHFENVMDPDHLPILHFAFSGPQFGFVTDPAQRLTSVKRSFSTTEISIKNEAHSVLPSGRSVISVVETALPTLRCVPLPRGGDNLNEKPEGFEPVESIGWVLPIDDTHYRIYVAGRVQRKGQLGELRAKFNGKFWSEMTDEEHQKWPGDYEAQTSQGAITLHSEERLVPGDQGIVLLRRFLKAQVKRVAEGLDPVGVSFDEDAPPVQLVAGRYMGPKVEADVAAPAAAE